jgi:hypothetical protein
MCRQDANTMVTQDRRFAFPGRYGFRVGSGSSRSRVASVGIVIALMPEKSGACCAVRTFCSKNVDLAL